MKARKHFRKDENIPAFVYEDEGDFAYSEDFAIRNAYKEYYDFSNEYDKHCDKIDQFANQRVIEELENIEELMLSCSGNEEHFDVVEERIKELKQE